MATFERGLQITQSSQGDGTASSDQRPVSISARLGRLQFHKSGKFRVLQLAAIEDGPHVSPDTIKLIETSLDTARPDIVIFTGNQIAGYDAAYSTTFRKRRSNGMLQAISSQVRARNDQDIKHTRELVRGSMAQFLKPLIDRGIPWVVTYGNHDFQCGLDLEELDAMYREFPGCMNVEPHVANPKQPQRLPGSLLPDQLIYSCEPGTLALPVSDLNREHTVMALMLINSGDYARAGGYGSPSTQALDFMQAMHDVMQARSLVFQHFALQQYYRLLKHVPPNAAHAIQGYRTFSDHYYILNDELVEPGGYLGEGISCPDEDPGEFEVLAAGRYLGVMAGHDHRNGFVGRLDQLLLVATPTCGFGSYGPAPERCAARLVEFDLRHPHEPRTQLLEFGTLVGKPTSRRAYTFAVGDQAQLPGKSTDLLTKPSKLTTLLPRLRGRR